MDSVHIDRSSSNSVAVGGVVQGRDVANRINGFGQAHSIAVGIGEVDLAAPRLIVDGDAELDTHRVDVVDPDVDEPVGVGITDVLGEVELRCFAADPDVGGKVRFEAVFEDLFEAESAIPGNGAGSVGNSQDRHHIGGHGLAPTATKA